MKIKDFKNKVIEEDKNTIAVDFDGVIHKNSKGFSDGTVYDEPVEGVKEGLEYLSKSYKLVIYSCKASNDRPFVNGKTGSELIYDWLVKYKLDSYIHDIVYEKTNAKYYIDDKAIKFLNWNQVLEEVV